MATPGREEEIVEQPVEKREEPKPEKIFLPERGDDVFADTIARRNTSETIAALDFFDGTFGKIDFGEQEAPMLTEEQVWQKEATPWDKYIRSVIEKKNLKPEDIQAVMEKRGMGLEEAKLFLASPPLYQEDTVIDIMAQRGLSRGEAEAAFASGEALANPPVDPVTVGMVGAGVAGWTTGNLAKALINTVTSAAAEYPLGMVLYGTGTASPYETEDVAGIAAEISGGIGIALTGERILQQSAEKLLQRLGMEVDPKMVQEIADNAMDMLKRQFGDDITRGEPIGFQDWAKKFHGQDIPRATHRQWQKDHGELYQEYERHVASMKGRDVVDMTEADKVSREKIGKALDFESRAKPVGSSGESVIEAPKEKNVVDAIGEKLADQTGAIRIFGEAKDLDVPKIRKSFADGKPISQAGIKQWRKEAARVGLSEKETQRTVDSMLEYNRVVRTGQAVIMPDMPMGDKELLIRLGVLNTPAIQGIRWNRTEQLFEDIATGKPVSEVGELFEGGRADVKIRKQWRGMTPRVFLNVPITQGYMSKARPPEVDYPMVVTGNPHLTNFKRPDPSWDGNIVAVRIKPIFKGNAKATQATIDAINYANEIGAKVLVTTFRSKNAWVLANLTDDIVPTDPKHPDFSKYWKKNPKGRPEDPRKWMDHAEYEPKEAAKKLLRAAGWKTEKDIYGKGGTWWWPESKELDPKIAKAIDGKTKLEYCDLLHKGCTACRNCQKLTYPKAAGSPIAGVTDEPFCEHGCPQCFVRQGQSGTGGRQGISMGLNLKQAGFGEADLGDTYSRTIAILQRVAQEPKAKGRTDYAAKFLDVDTHQQADIAMSLYLDKKISADELANIQYEINQALVKSGEIEKESKALQKLKETTGSITVGGGKKPRPPEEAGIDRRQIERLTSDTWATIERDAIIEARAAGRSAEDVAEELWKKGPPPAGQGATQEELTASITRMYEGIPTGTKFGSVEVGAAAGEETARIGETQRLAEQVVRGLGEQADEAVAREFDMRMKALGGDPEKPGVVLASEEDTAQVLAKEMTGHFDIPEPFQKYHFNINFSRINDENDLHSLFQSTINLQKQNMSTAGRGTMTLEEIQKSAEATAYSAGMDVETFLKGWEGGPTGWDLAEQMNVGRIFLVESFNQLKRLSNEVQISGSKESMFLMRKQLGVHNMLLQYVSRATREVARAQSAQRIMAKGMKDQMKQVEEILRNEPIFPGMAAGKTGRTLSDAQLAEMISKLDSPDKVSGFVSKAYKANAFDLVYEVWINNMLTSVGTHVANLTGTGIKMLLTFPERAIAGAWGKALPSEELGNVKIEEAVAMAQGIKEGAVDAFRLLAKAFMDAPETKKLGLNDVITDWYGSKTGKELDLGEGPLDDVMTKMEFRPKAWSKEAWSASGKFGEFIDILGGIINSPTRALGVEDNAMKAFAYRLELHALATRKVLAEGLDGDAATRRYMEILRDPPEELHIGGIEFARDATFTKELGKFARTGQRLINMHPFLRLVVPFYRTPTNIGKDIIQRTPLALFTRDLYKMGPEGDMARAKATLGSMICLAVASLVTSDRITGAGPADPRVRKNKSDLSGWKPYSVKFGDQYLQYNRLDPIGGIVGLAADTTEVLMQSWESEDFVSVIDETLAAITVAIGQNMSSKLYLKRLSEMIDAFSSGRTDIPMDPDEAKMPSAQARFWQSLAGSLVPAMVGQVARAEDPVKREAQSMLDRIKSRMPGLSKDLPADRDIWGREVVTEGALGPDLLSPFYTSSAKDDPLDLEIVRLKLPVGRPSKQIDGVELEQDLYVEYQKIAGKNARTRCEQYFNSTQFKNNTDAARSRMFKSIFTNARKDARKEMLSKHSDLRVKVGELRRREQEELARRRAG